MVSLSPRAFAAMLGVPALLFALVMAGLAIAIGSEYGPQGLPSLILLGLLIPAIVAAISAWLFVGAGALARHLAIASSSLGALHSLCVALFALMLVRPLEFPHAFLAALLLGVAVLDGLLLSLALRGEVEGMGEEGDA